ncbi:MAG TPA: peptidoglycan DD-metalloendopeptidase family protein, partial [Rhodocyclaceae bacterium]|nr:peptidoglycan DD-metalloendopeptidase family protein [Rhodocyclaceae bacterium]
MFGGLAAAVLGLVSACAAPGIQGAAPKATAFIATRVVTLLTQNAATDVARHSLTATASTPRPSKTPTPSSTVTDPPPTPTLTRTASATSTASPSPTQPGPSPTPAGILPTGPCADQACASAVGHFWLERPIPSAYVNYPDRTYPYGGTLNGTREPHHGVEFVNSSGTPIVAAGPGQVVVAGNDHTTAYGPTVDFYGNLVVVQLDQTFAGQPVFNLYGHMKSISVTVGQHVNTGDRLGLVGATGVAIGPHLHFEVRVGANTYASSRNPELWLKPLRYNGVYEGVIAGRVVDTHGQPVNGYALVIRPISVDSDTPQSRYITTYTPDGLGVQGDDRLGENFGVTDLPIGMY